ncbi:hypothetical protein OC834_007686 [Tilletia horrida]|nr:hypothetical protein OC834_007686 [Tilletia horrida]
MMAACVVNHSGAANGFKAADLDIEHLVNDLKNVFPVQAKAGGLDRQRRIGEIHPTLASIKDDLFRTYGISSLDGTHTRRDHTFTSRLISEELQQYRAFTRQPQGRQSPVFTLYGSDRLRKKSPKHLKTDSVLAGVDSLIGTSSKKGAIPSFWERRRDDHAEDFRNAPDFTDGDVQVHFDAEQDASGFGELDAD